MNGPSRADRILMEGPHGIVEYAVRANGAMEAKEWFDAQDERLRASLGVLFERLVNAGRITNVEQFRNLKDEVWEFKRKEHRLLCYHLGRRWLLTHHYKKARQKCPPAEIKRADRIGKEHIQWEMSQRKKK